MNGEVLKSFLVSLGFGVDKKGMDAFTSGIKQASVKVAAMAGAVKVAAAGIFYAISKVSEGFENLGYEYRIISPMLNKTIMLRRELLKAYSEAGIKIVDAVKASVKFNFSLAKTKYQFEAIYKSVAVKFIPTLTKGMDAFRKKVSENMPAILSTLEKMVKFIFKVSDGISILALRAWSMLSRVYTIFEKLHDLTGGWSTAILAAATAWKVLNLSFLATPIGAIVAGLVFVLTLLDDLMTWQEGGESMFDWSRWVPSIKAFGKAFEEVKDIATVMYSGLENLFMLLKNVFTGNFSDAFDNLTKNFKIVWEFLSKIANLATGSGFDFLKNVGGTALDSIAGLFDSAPAAGSGTTSTSQNVTQETNITIAGGGNPSSIAQEVSGAQGRVNADLARNLRGAVR